jgi:hypothetical protein
MVAVAAELRSPAVSGPRLVARLFVMGLVLVFSAGAEEKRPSKHTAYAEGIRAFRNEEWKEANDHLLAALKNWPTEDGELTRLYGAWFVPYLPELYLGVAYFELGCFQDAKKHLESSVLNKKTIRRAEEEQKMLTEYSARVAEQLRLGTEPSKEGICERPK